MEKKGRGRRRQRDMKDEEVKGGGGGRRGKEREKWKGRRLIIKQTLNPSICNYNLKYPKAREKAKN